MCAHANSHWPISFENWKHHDASQNSCMGVRVASSIDRMYRLLSGQYDHVNALTDLVEGRIIIGIHLSRWAQVPAHQ